MHGSASKPPANSAGLFQGTDRRVVTGALRDLRSAASARPARARVRPPLSSASSGSSQASSPGGEAGLVGE
eukprot:8098145-Alexandrium_andersonii.AAC.1